MTDTPPPGSREAAQALDEIEAALAQAETELKVAHEALGEFANILSREPYEANRAYDAMSDVQAASRRIPTLRAALAPANEPTFPDIQPHEYTFGKGKSAPAADGAGEVEEIRERHAYIEAICPDLSARDRSHADRATLLEEHDRQRYAIQIKNNQIEELEELLSEERARRVEVEGALEEVRLGAENTIDFYNRNGPQWTSKETGQEYYSASYVIGSAEEVIAIVDRATNKDTQDE